MTGGFRHINVRDITDNSFEAIGKDWMLVTAGNSDKFNMMTANWGTFGIFMAQACSHLLYPSSAIYLRTG